MLSSFKHKLALYFLLLAVLPLGLAFWGLGTLAKRAEERRVDARLEAELRALSAVDTGRLGRLPMLRSDSKLASGDRVTFLPRSKTKTGPAYVSVSGSRYRALATAPLAERPRPRLALLPRTYPIDAAAATTRRPLLYVFLGCPALLAASAAA